jgi:large subunit ribosomal protein L29
MKAKDMREKSPEDLRELEKTLTRDAFQARLKNFTNRLDDTSQIRKTRRDLARVKTLLGELRRTGTAAVGTAGVAPAAASVSSPASAGKPKKKIAEKAAPKKRAATGAKARSEASK